MKAKLNLKLVPLGIAAVTAMMFASAVSAQTRPSYNYPNAGPTQYNTSKQTPDSAQVIGGGAPTVRNGMGGSPQVHYPSSSAVAVTSYCALYSCEGQQPMTVTSSNSGGGAPTISYGHVENGNWASDTAANQPEPQIVGTPWKPEVAISTSVGPAASGGGYNPSLGWDVMNGFNPHESAQVQQASYPSVPAQPAYPIASDLQLFRSDAPPVYSLAAPLLVAPVAAVPVAAPVGPAGGGDGGVGGDGGDGGGGDGGGSGGDSA